jgi:metal-dependent amidase/aminoacylase/carboxypeptidase family protein
MARLVSREGKIPGVNEERSKLKEALWLEAERRGREIIRLAERFRLIPETGFAEFRTSGLLFDYLEQVPGLEVQRGVAVTGVIATLRTGRQGPRVALTADLDALEDGHLCGHHMQISTLAAVASILSRSELRKMAGGEVRFLACPAEEYAENGYRKQLLQTNKILDRSGKLDFLRRGIFDGLDAVISVHLAEDLPERRVILAAQAEGFWLVRVTGKMGGNRFHTWRQIRRILQEWMHAAEAGGQRRVILREEDNSEIFEGRIYLFEAAVHEPLRERLAEQLKERLQDDFPGFQVEWEEGYAPFCQDQELAQLAVRQVSQLLGEKAVTFRPLIQGATDLGNVAGVVPVIQPLIGGTVGMTHSPSFRVIDPWMAYVFPVKLVLGILVDILLDFPLTNGKRSH